MERNVGRECPSESDLRKFLSGETTDTAIAEIGAHLGECDSCCGRAAAIEEGLKAALFLNQDTPRDAILREVENLLAPSDDPEALGTIDHYTIRECIARGGMGIVLRGWDPTLRRDVAIKLLAPDKAYDPVSRERFLNEARSAALLDHPNITPHPRRRAGCESALPGHRIQRWRDSGREDPTRGCAADRGDVPHRPGSGDRSGRSAPPRDHPSRHQTREHPSQRRQGAHRRLRPGPRGGHPHVTQTGVVAGTPAYMAPEQFDSAEIDHRADLFGLGSLLHCMATGHAPFDAPSALAVMKRITLEETPSLSSSSGVPDWFADLVSHLLEKDPHDRIQTADEVTARLASCGRNRAETETPQRPSFPLLAIAVGIAAIVAALFFVFRRDSPPIVAAPQPPPSPILVEETGVRYATLPDAIAAAPPGGTLTIHAPTLLIAPLTLRKPLRIRAAPATSPIITLAETDIENDYLFFAEVPVALEGLTFHLKTGQSSTSPMTGARNGMAMTHCRVEREWIGKKPHSSQPAIMGLSKGGRFQHCLFICPGGRGFGSSNGSAPEETHLQIDDSVFCSLVSLVYYSPKRGTRWRTSLRHCSFASNTAIAITGEYLDFNDASFTSESCAFQALNQVVWMGIPHKAETLPWSGRDNIFSARNNLLLAKARSMTATPVFVARDLESWRRLINSSEEGSRIAELDFVGQMGLDIDTPGSELLHENITLENFRLPAGLPENLQEAGAHLDRVGPGAPYHRWRNSAEYPDWLKETKTLLSAPQETPWRSPQCPHRTPASLSSFAYGIPTTTLRGNTSRRSIPR